MKRVKEVSRLAGVSRRALQYYDDEGLLVAERSEHNYRLYDQKALERIWRIMIYKEMGFDLKEIKRLLSATEVGQKKYLSSKEKEIGEKISELNGQRKFISVILTQGMPRMPEENMGITYADRISELRKREECM